MAFRSIYYTAICLFLFSLLPAHQAQAQCGFNQYNDYICQGGGQVPAAKPPGFPPPQTQQAIPKNTYTAPIDSQAGMDYAAYLRDLKAQMKAAEDELAYQIAHPLQHGGVSGPLGPIQCGEVPSTGGRSMALNQDFGRTQYRPKGLSDGTFIDATGASATLDNCGHTGATNPYPFMLENCSNCVWHGGVVHGTIPPGATRDYCNSSALTAFRGASNFTVNSFVAHDVWDGIRYNPRDSADTGTFTIQNSYVANAHDDCVENDAGHNMVIQNSLFDGCLSGISLDPGKNGMDQRENTRTVVLDNVLLRIQEHDPNNRGGGPAAFLKTHSSSPSIEIYNTVFAFEELGHADKRWAQAMGKTKACENNYLLWMSDAPFPSAFNDAKTRQCFTILTGNAARQMWKDRKNGWLAECGA